MPYIVDTNVISEGMKESPDQHVLDWLDQNAISVMLTSVTVEELRFGEFMMPEGKRRNILSSLIDETLRSYAATILPFDTIAAECCAEFHQQAIIAGRTPSIEDMMIASIAKTNNCTLATRNIRDFDFLDLPVVNPFD